MRLCMMLNTKEIRWCGKNPTSSHVVFMGSTPNGIGHFYVVEDWCSHGVYSSWLSSPTKDMQTESVHWRKCGLVLGMS